MDPLSILSLVEACAGLAVTAGKLAIGLKSLADGYKSSALMFTSLSSQCKLFATAVRAIQAWMEDISETSNIDERIWEQLADSLECANTAIYALEDQLVMTSKGTINTFWEKVNVMWNMEGLRDLNDCIHKQITSLGVLLQIMNLPTRQNQTDGLAEQSYVFQESRSSTLSICDTDTSTIQGLEDDEGTIRSVSTITTKLSQMPHFDFEEMLQTSQVYLRNRNKTLALNSPESKSRKMRDAGTYVGPYDLPPKFPWLSPFSVHNWEFIAAKSGGKEELISFLQTDLIPKHEILLAKYNKVKRYYFEREERVRQLERALKDSRRVL